MVINDGLCWFKNVLKKQLSIAARLYLSLALILSPIFLMNDAIANTSALGGWEIVNKSMEGATRVYNGAKNSIVNGASFAKTSVAKYKPTAAQVAKGIGRTGAVLAVDLAIKSLLGAVDYVMDPANNQVKYTKLFPCTPSLCTSYQYVWLYNNLYYESYQDACNAMFAVVVTQSSLAYGLEKTVLIDDNTARCYFYSTIYPDLDNLRFSNPVSRIVNPTYNPSSREEERTIPYTDIAQEIIDTAESGDTRAGGYAGDVADWELSNTPSVQQNVKQQLDANAKTNTAENAAEATGNTKPNTANPDVTDISLEFPAFCGWAPTVCEAAQTVITFPTTLTNWWDTSTSSITQGWQQVKDWVQDATDFFNQEPDTPEPDPLDIPDLPVNAEQITLNADNTCPTDSVNFNLAGQAVTLQMPYQPVCNALNFFRPAVLVVGAIASVYIVAGVRTKEDE